MKILLLIDAHALIHRCFHALPPFKNKDGEPTGALYGLSSILIKILHPEKKDSLLDGINGELPTYVAALFDRPEPTFRKKIYDDYKAQRPKAPDELVSQIIASRPLFEAFDIKTFEIPGFEGDDLIGTAVEKFKNYPELKIIILTGDLDTVQLIENERIMVETIKKGVSETMIYNEEEVKNRFGVFPNQIADYKSLVGDASDNIKGVPGIGPKTAAAILQKYDTIENFFKNGQEEKNYQKIMEFKDQSITSKYLAEIRKDAPLEINIQDLKYEGLPKEKLIKHFESLGFQSMIKRL